jgi:hypothetical protein
MDPVPYGLLGKNTPKRQWDGHRGGHARQRLGTRVGAVLGWRQGLLCEKMERWRLKWLTSGGHFIISNYY